ncbi:MAG: metallophosphoesterase [Ignavibacteriaceae bacterium]
MVAVIGDVHGCFYTLQNLVEKIRAKYPDIKIYCVGDLVDRGNYSLEVIDYVLSESIEFTKGNHDLMFYAFYRDPNTSMAKNWIQNGAATTIESYINNVEKRDEHLNVIYNAPLFINTVDCFISHAGISKFYQKYLKEYFLNDLVSLKNLLESDLFENHSVIWCRQNLMNIGKLQIVGHTHRKDTFYDHESNTVYLDTTAFGLNKLTAAIIENSKVIEMIEQPTFKDDSDSRWKYYL